MDFAPELKTKKACSKTKSWQKPCSRPYCEKLRGATTSEVFGAVIFSMAFTIALEKRIVTDRPQLLQKLADAHRVGGNRKRNQQSMNADQKSIGTVFSISICRQRGNK